jgi:hypothetical protein
MIQKSISSSQQSCRLLKSLLRGREPQHADPKRTRTTTAIRKLKQLSRAARAVHGQIARVHSYLKHFFFILRSFASSNAEKVRARDESVDCIIFFPLRLGSSSDVLLLRSSGFFRSILHCAPERLSVRTILRRSMLWLYAALCCEPYECRRRAKKHKNSEARAKRKA